VKVLAPEAVTKEAILLDDANPEDFNIEGQGIGVSDFQAQCDPEGCCSSSQSRADSRARAFQRMKNDAQTRYDNRLGDYDSKYNDIGGTEGRDRLLEQQWRSGPSDSKTLYLLMCRSWPDFNQNRTWSVGLRKSPPNSRSIAPT